MNKATVIIPTTGAPEVRDAIDSVLAQTVPTTCYIVCDGPEFEGKVSAIVSDYKGDDRIKVCYLPINVGANGFYGHRVYASFTHLVDTEYVMYLDQDCWLDTNHVKSCIETIEKKNVNWCYSLRKIYDKDNNFVCRDDCESLEVSTKSNEKLGQRLSAFNLKIDTKIGEITIESAFQGSKVFEHGGPYTDIYKKDSRDAKSMQSQFFF